MASETQYLVVEFDNEASGPFVAEGANLTWTGGVGFIVSLVQYVSGSMGKLHIALVSGVNPTNNLVLTQGTVTADCSGPAANGDSEELLYPAYARPDLTVAASGAVSWAGAALGMTHSFFFDGQTVNCVVGDIITFADSQKCELITIESDAGVSGEYSVRWITPLDTLEFPDDNDTFTSSPTGGNGALNGVVHTRCYSPLNMHRLLGDLNDDEIPAGNDLLSSIDPIASDKSTDQIIDLLGTVTISDTVAQHMYGGSINQTGGDTLYSGLDIQITDSDGDTEPVVIKNDAIVTAYWANAYMPDSVAGRVRLLIKTRDEGSDFDRKKVTGKLLRYGDIYFEGSTTLGTGTTALALFSSPDGNNETAEGTVAGAPYNTIVITEGYQSINYNNGNGDTPFGLKFDYGSATSAQAYERWKYIQRENSSETLFSRNARLVTGVTRNFAYDGQTGNFTEDEIIAWGTEITYSNQAVGAFAVDNVVSFVGSGAIGRIMYDDDQGTTGTLLVAIDGTIVPLATDTILDLTTGATADVDTVNVYTTAGRGLLIADYDAGATGNFYYQHLVGNDPADGQTVFGSTSNSEADVNGAVSTRVINNQYVGVYTGSNFQTNFGIGGDATDAIFGDKLRNLLGVVQNPPNNQSGVVSGGFAGDRLMVYPWDGTSYDVNSKEEPNFDEEQLATALVAGVSTQVDVGVAGIPVNTPQLGWLRVERNSDGEYDLIEYDSHDGSRYYEIVGTAPSAAAIANNVMRAPLDTIWTTTGTPESFSAVQGGTNKWVIMLRRGGVNPIKPFTGNAEFGATGFSAAVQRITDA